MWQHVLDCLDTDPDKLDRQIDWVIKRKLIQSWVDKHDTTWTDPRVLMLDLQYHDIRRERSLYYLLERKGAVDRLFTDEEVDAAKTEPPPDTRARMRGETADVAALLLACAYAAAAFVAVVLAAARQGRAARQICDPDSTECTRSVLPGHAL